MRPIPILLAALLSLASVIAGPPKIATVDMQELFRQYHRTEEAQKQINIERARIQQDNNERLARIRELESTLGNLRRQLDDPAVADTRKQRLFKDWQIQQQEGIALDRERREFLQRRNQALNETMVQRMKGILEEIGRLVDEQARNDDFDFVFDKSGLSTSQVPVLLYSKDATDITALLLKNLNRDAPGDEARPLLPDSITPPEDGLRVIIDGWSQEELAAEAGSSVKAVECRLARLRRSLKKHLTHPEQC
jgi:outer membrane protein